MLKITEVRNTDIKEETQEDEVGRNTTATRD
jgi:hypothetical protein